MKNKFKALFVLFLCVACFGVNRLHKYVDNNRKPTLIVCTTENGERDIDCYVDGFDIVELASTSNVINMKHDKRVSDFGIAVEHNDDSITFKQTDNYIELPDEKGEYKVIVYYYLDNITYRYIFKVDLI